MPKFPVSPSPLPLAWLFAYTNSSPFRERLGGGSYTLRPPQRAPLAYFFTALYDSMVLVCMMMAVSPLFTDRLSVVIVRVTLHEVSPNAIATAVTMASARYLMALTSRCFCSSVNGFIAFQKL